MKTFTLQILCLSLLALLLLQSLTALGEGLDACETQKARALEALSEQLLSDRECVWVYHDFTEQRNRYTQRAKMEGGGAIVHDMDENWQTDPYSGTSCIRCEISAGKDGWGGWSFLSGVLPEGETVPQLNLGKSPDEGMDLSGAIRLSFWARGEKGGEVVEVFTCGFGWSGDTPDPGVPYPDSERQHRGYVTLTTQWQRFVIDLSDADMSCIACGFGFVAAGRNAPRLTQVFYLDDIRFEGFIAEQWEAPMLLRAYDTDNAQLINTAYVYDNALAAMAFISEDMQREARWVLDALVYAMNHDRYQPGRIRNAYVAGDPRPTPGWHTGVSLPGWWDERQRVWCEDRTQVGSNVGNTSYVALALLQYDAAYGNAEYVQAAQTLMDWVIDSCTAGGDGFIAGLDGWPEGDDPVVYPLTYKSVEHNIDAYAAFARLYALTGEERYRVAADSARRFLISMYSEEEGCFYTGTTADGVTPDTGSIVLDTQVWSALALGEDFAPYAKSLDRVRQMSVDGAYPFCESNANGGWWAEGTAFTALMWQEQGDEAAAAAALQRLCDLQLPSGLLPAASVDHLSTGIYTATGEPWEYGYTPHLASTAWFIMAVNGLNPYTF